ncbi:MAG TPA: polysaccharide lyase family protein, partial [Phycisphaerae bacterium]|nr:polysaccharide lyase family protein [Phycisphaerae bacterium]
MKLQMVAAGLIAASIASVVHADVTVTQDDAFFTLDNGTVKAMVSKKSGDLVSMKFKGVEMLATTQNADGAPNLATDPPGDPGRGRGMTDHMYGFWSHDAVADRIECKVTIDPKNNGGKRGEVSVKGFSDGKKLGHGPGAPAGGDFAADIDIRYSLGEDDTGVYTYCEFDHKPEYPDSTMGEARFCIKANSTFDWIMIDEHHHMPYPREYEANGDNKYNYTTVQYEHPAFGWASSTAKTGIFFVNASVEYLTGAPTKTEFLCHRDTTGPNYYPCILNYWRSSHYGGGGVDVAKGEAWKKVVGPFMIYCNNGETPDEMWHDAIAQAGREKAKWPYEWVDGVDYAKKGQRSTVSGTIALTDPIKPDAKMSRLRIGVAYPDYHITVDRPSVTNALADLTWQTDSKHYSFWAEGNPETGQFSIPNVRAGKYTLHGLADGVLGEFTKTDITVEEGKPLDLGKLAWTPVRKGKQLWDIGIPNRSGSEFAKGDDYFHDGMANVYAQMFPDDVNYTIGKSDFRKDWFYAQLPHGTPGPYFDPANGRRGLGGGGGGPARATPWKVNFTLGDQPKGKAILRLGIATANTRMVTMTVNGQNAGGLNNLPGDSALGRNG